MKRLPKLLVACLLIPLVSACSHNIQINPPLDELRAMEMAPKIDKSVAYYIPMEVKNKTVTTPGGGGDKISYQPYKDTEGALNTMLSQAFTRVYSLSDINNQAFLTAKNVSFVFQPTIVTDSSSSSAFTWPATDFTFELTCVATDPAGQQVLSKTVSAQGHAEYDEFIKDFSLSSRRAAEKAFQQMLMEIKQSPELRD